VRLSNWNILRSLQRWERSTALPFCSNQYNQHCLQLLLGSIHGLGSP